MQIVKPLKCLLTVMSNHFVQSFHSSFHGVPVMSASTHFTPVPTINEIAWNSVKMCTFRIQNSNTASLLSIRYLWSFDAFHLLFVICAICVRVKLKGAEGTTHTQTHTPTAIGTVTHCWKRVLRVNERSTYIGEYFNRKGSITDFKSDKFLRLHNRDMKSVDCHVVVSFRSSFSSL